MKKIAIAVAVSIAGSGALINTATADTYIGGKIGLTKLDDACYIGSPCDDDGVGLGFHAGYNFTDMFALEYGVDYLDDYKGNFRSGQTIDADLWAMTLAPKITFAATDTWDVFVKAGGAYMISDDEKDIVPTASVGAEYDINYNLTFRAEYQYYHNMSDDIIHDMNANFFSIGFNYRFGAAPVVAATAMAIAPKPAPAPEPIVMSKMHKESFGTGTFKVNSSELTDAFAARLGTYAAIMKQHPHSKAEIVGYTDSSGSADYNQKLSEKRAQAVADHLIESGVNTDQLTIKGMGEANPIADNATVEGREKNRRIELSIPEFEYKEIQNQI